jgi:hypothetical protein
MESPFEAETEMWTRFDSRRLARRNGDDFAGAIAGRFAGANANRCD